MKKKESSDELLKRELAEEPKPPIIESASPVEVEKPTIRQEYETRKAGIKDSEELQKQGWKVVGIFNKDGKRIHRLQREK